MLARLPIIEQRNDLLLLPRLPPDKVEPVGILPGRIVSFMHDNLFGYSESSCLISEAANEMLNGCGSV